MEKKEKFSSVEEMIKNIEERSRLRSIWEKIWDYIIISIIGTLVDILHPRYNWYRLGRLYQRITIGWDDSDLWSLDYTIAKEFLPKLDTLITDINGSFIEELKWAFCYSIGTPSTEESIDDWYKVLKIYEAFGKEFLNLRTNFIYEFSGFVFPRLSLFVKNYENDKYCGIPGDIAKDDTDESYKEAAKLWGVYLNKMLISFTAITYYDSHAEDYGLGRKSFIKSLRNKPHIKEGFELFGKYFSGLWT